MKVFHKDKYQFIGINFVDGLPYYAFKCIKEDFDPEIVLVRQAKINFTKDLSLYFDESRLVYKHEVQQYQSLCVSLMESYIEMMSLADNESNWCDRRAYSEVDSLTQGIRVTWRAA